MIFPSYGEIVLGDNNPNLAFGRGDEVAHNTSTFSLHMRCAMPNIMWTTATARPMIS